VARRPPELAVRQDQSGVVVSWRSSQAGYQLQSAEHLEPPTTWRTVTQPPVVHQARNVVTNPTGSDQRFFRLTQ
jgi:hypothetical protein